MPKYNAYGTVVGSTYIGEFEAKNEKEAIEKAQRAAGVSLCHECARDISDPEVTEINVELVEDENDSEGGADEDEEED